MNVFQLFSLLLALVALPHLQAGCPRCQEIEQARSEEQAKHPQSSEYYEDYLKNHPEAQQQNSQKNPNQKNQNQKQ